MPYRFFACAVFTLIFLLPGRETSAQQKHHFAFAGNRFMLDGKPFRIISGEMHPARIPREYWQHRIRMAKAMGCNTIAAYVFWNYLETREGTFDFRSENRDIAAFIRLCQDEGLRVLLRPGPYVCAEWDFGGLPAYLLKQPDIKLRCSDPVYLSAAERYMKALSKEVLSLQCDHGGPILMVQIENEYGSFGNDKAYLERLRKIWTENGITVPYYTSDGPTPYMLDAGHIAGAAIGMDSGSSETDFETARKHDPTVPAFSSETYPGWLTHWGEKWARPDTASLRKEMQFLLSTNKSFNLYVVHGGTNFGFTAGANAFSPTEYQPDITSYDYDAPISEQGLATPKYMLLRSMIAQYTGRKLPRVPKPVKTMEVPEISMHKTHAFWDLTVSSNVSPQPKTMEFYGQNQGAILYKTKLIGHKSGKLKIWEPHDFALVYLNGKFVDTVFRDGGKWEVELPKSDVKDPELAILVEGMGHINFAQFMIDRKGITDRVTLNGMTLMNWEITLYPLDEAFVRRAKPGHVRILADQQTCSFFEGDFTLKNTADTYIDLSAYSKGNVYVNGHNLGRYWKKGPQQRLYCPAGWLRKGANRIVVFDFLQAKAAPVRGFRTWDNE